MNGGIILKRLRIEYKALAEMVESMEIGALDATSIKALKEYLPTVDERNQLQSYLKAAGDSKDIREKLYGDLSDCEKYMICMMDIAKADDHFDCMLFRVQFRSRFDELIDCLRTVDKACDEVRSSEKFRQIMAIILTVVNQINTGGEGKGQAMGFNLETLLKLNEAKAFDKKTSVLQYLIKVVKRNDESLIEFHKDLPHTNDSVNIILDSLCSDIKALKDDLEKVFKTSQEQADELLDLGITSKLSLSELKEQKTNVRSLSGVSQFNQVDHLTGRTPMERFCLHAKASIDEAYELTSQVQVKFRSLLQYFGEDEKMASNEFFGTLKRFISDFNNANQIVQKEEKMRLREMKRQESMKQTDRRISLEKQNKQVPESIEVVKSSPMSSASAISAFFAAKRGMDSDLKDRLPGSDAATGGVSLVDISSAVYSSSTLGGAQVPVGTDKDQGIDAEADKSEVCKLGKLSPHAAVAKSASSTSTKQSSLPGGDQTDTVVAAIGASNTKLPFVHCCDSLPAIMCTDKEKEKELSGASSVCEVSKDGGDDGDSKIPSA
ncbi:hypothetical protein FisN_5Hh257 [Fistulifera solaris]|uniref:FH2 domain-containing protein n=1 Tax=Fistulifera solaris TaxID=1519565 RepID=A0A1Z5JS86_FISSO|nr:hypothetical protein FisN_5Hh257 [Fistulifera solaris]|eukprot:GAX16884.1 hypothetical protein FisN_5Hh257 [Fistulifera solaris]